MWEDEEGAVYFSQHLDKPFARAFPNFFLGLHGVYEVTGVSVAAGRVFNAVIALLGLGIGYATFRHFLGHRVALLACFLLAINLGHLFWSQSIRYYCLLLFFELISIACFLIGFERKSVVALLLSVAAFALGMLTHYSGILLVPVFVGYLLLVAALRRDGCGAYNLKGYLAFGLPLAAVLVAFATALVRMQGMLGGLTIPSARQPVHVFATVVAYFGLPLLALGLLSPLIKPASLPRRTFLFCLVMGIIPVLELVVIARLNLINVAWYYALFALVGFAVLAAISLLGLWDRGRRKLAFTGGALATLYYAALLGGYYTVMHGDRPRWEEAACYLRDTAGVRVEVDPPPEVYANVPGVVQYYLTGLRTDATSGFAVHQLPPAPPATAPEFPQWYVVEAGHVTAEYRLWLLDNCTVLTRFEAHTGPYDRTLTVYHYAGDPMK
jgi:dolichyl-phosphate-mannose-protein mannosyltransferase